MPRDRRRHDRNQRHENQGRWNRCTRVGTSLGKEIQVRADQYVQGQSGHRRHQGRDFVRPHRSAMPASGRNGCCSRTCQTGPSPGLAKIFGRGLCGSGTARHPQETSGAQPRVKRETCAPFMPKSDRVANRTQTDRMPIEFWKSRTKGLVSCGRSVTPDCNEAIFRKSGTDDETPFCPHARCLYRNSGPVSGPWSTKVLSKAGTS